MKKWQLESREKIKSAKDLIRILLENRNIKTKNEIDDFLNPELSNITVDSVNINRKDLKKAQKRVKEAIKTREKIIIYGDYDADGVCGTAILWESLNFVKANVMPYIPSRFDEGYGLSKEGIDNLIKREKPDLIITVDNGIVANSAVDYANKKGIDVIITDHHVPSKKLPDALAVIHTTSVCGAAVAYLLSRELKINDGSHLELVALATIADLVPLTGANRAFVYYGLQSLRKTKRPGLLALIEKSGILREEIGVYEIGHVIAPRLNAMGRIENAMDSLRLICTKDRKRALSLAAILADTNFQRQRITSAALESAKGRVGKKEIKNLIFIADESYQQGIVGLVAGRLVEEYYFPSIVISKGEKFSKASARSVKGFNIIEFLRTASDLLVDVGGHPMAAGFTVETKKIRLLEKKLMENAAKLIKKEHLERILRIDAELNEEFISTETYSKIQKLSPFGMANPEPTFLTKNLIIESIRPVGNDGKHLKLQLKTQNSKLKIDGIFFGAGKASENLKTGDNTEVVYTLDENFWKGNKSLQLKIKDLRIN